MTPVFTGRIQVERIWDAPKLSVKYPDLFQSQQLMRSYIRFSLH